MPQKQIEYAEGYVRDVHSNGESVGRFTFEIDKFKGEKWFQTTPVHLVFNLVPGITSDDVGKRLKILIEVEETVDTDLET